MASTRRLTAILAADVAGYSRLMGADEEGTHERLKAHRRELVDPKIKEHQGRIVKTTTGDGMLVEFATVVDAVRYAAEVQRGMIDRARRAANQVSHRRQSQRHHRRGRRHLRRRRQCRSAPGGAGGARRDLHFADGARPYPRQTSLFV
jgi:class 3 adenylate cyclase